MNDWTPLLLVLACFGAGCIWLAIALCIAADDEERDGWDL